MKSFIQIIFLISVIVLDNSIFALEITNEPLITREMTEFLKQNVDWEVTEYSENIFKDWSVSDFLGFIGQTEPFTDNINQLESDTLNFEDLPDHFDARTKWPKCIHPIRRQHNCGSCWAHTSTESLSDRFCIHKGQDFVLSVQDPVSCDKSNDACKGGSLVGVFQYLEKTGAVTEDCFPYTSGENGHVPPCPTKCPTGKPWIKHHCAAGSVKKMENIVAMKTELYNSGPIGTHFKLYRDFNYYKSGIYYHKAGEYVCGHYMKVIGWGVENNEHYWVIANSFGADWGDHGFVKFKMGDCGINEYMVSCLPA